MRWRNPRKERPYEDQLVWVMLYPHKHRGALKDSLASVEIVCGWAYRHGKHFRVENKDELGMGCIEWLVDRTEASYYQFEEVIAWIPADDLPLPDWFK